MVVTLGAGKRGGVVGEEGASEIVVGEAVGNLLPAGDAGPRVGLGQCPEVPRGPLGGIGGNGSAGQVTDDVAAAAMQPVGVGERDERPRIVRPELDDALVEGTGDFGAVAKRFGRGDEAVGIGFGGDRLQRMNERRKIGALLEGGNGGSDLRRGARVGARGRR